MTEATTLVPETAAFESSTPKSSFRSPSKDPRDPAAFCGVAAALCYYKNRSGSSLSPVPPLTIQQSNKPLQRGPPNYTGWMTGWEQSLGSARAVANQHLILLFSARLRVPVGIKRAENERLPKQEG